ncbi:MAG TPA: hypothetical protein VIU61_00410, partial [Kofleriaceae bacterium]
MVTYRWVLFVLAGCGAESVVTAAQPVQLERDEMFRVALGTEPGAKGIANRATAVVYAPLFENGNPLFGADGTPIRGSCGVTFVSAKFAFTAAHCVDDGITTSTVLEVEHITVAADSDWTGSTNLTGNFPNFGHPAMGSGYQTVSYQCQIKARCHADSADNINCPAGVDKADIALLQCTGSPGSVHGYLDIATVDEPDAAIEMPWKHEVYDLNPNKPDHFDHYTKRIGSALEDNFHYFGNDRNSPLPLLTRDWPEGPAHVKVDVPVLPGDEIEVGWTDLLGCHGTSGSGILQHDTSSNEYEFLGPVAAGAFNPVNELCQTPANHDPGDPTFGYSALAHAQALEDQIDDCKTGQDTGTDGYNILLALKCHRLRLPLLVSKWPFDFWPCHTCPPFERFRGINEPMVNVALGDIASMPGVQVQAGVRYRLAFRTHALAGAVEIGLRFGGDTIASRLAPRNDPAERPTMGVIATTFVPRTTGTFALDIISVSGSFAMNDFTIVRDGVTQSFDTMADRAGL